MDKTDLTRAVRDSTSLTGEQAKEAVNAVIGLIRQTLFDGGVVELRDFINLRVVSAAAAMVRNPATGATMTLPARRKVLARVSKKLQRDMNE